ncbi:lysine--tRNA ligase [Candidatus Woesearchaeota archaeon]|nr:lysine--tRNA ligase [Candidatus Woesearchaeota archaeon]
MPTEQELIDERLRKTAALREQGINPYPYRFVRSANAAHLQQHYAGLAAEQHTADKVAVAGRITGLRRMGKITFCHITDQDAKVQLYFKEETLGSAYAQLKLYDLGDWIGASGTIFKTKTGEITVEVTQSTMLAKAMRPLPEKWHGLQDQEARYRRRYLDLTINPDVRKTFIARSAIIAALRAFFHKRGFMEVETPILQPIYGGAAARPFTTHLHDLDLKMFMRISPELYHKRLIVGGFEKVFEIGKVFRNESIDRSHNPEFTLMECYQAYADYNDMMELTEDVYEHVAKTILGTTKFDYQGTAIDVKKPWKRTTMEAALKEVCGLDVGKMSVDELKDAIHSHHLEMPAEQTRGLLIAELFDKLASPHLIQPTFVIDHPAETTPLCKEHRTKPGMVERFEPFINGWEIGNAYSELNDPVKQRALLEEQADKLRSGQEEANPMDEDFIHALETGMPPTGGLGLGIDRMVMLFTNAPSIRDVLLFPTMKPEETPHGAHKHAE